MKKKLGIKVTILNNTYSAIMAIDLNGGVGVGDDLAIINKLDQAFFAGFTMGKACIVGYNTYEQVKGLKGRVLIRDERWEHSCPDGSVVIGGVNTYIKHSKQTKELLLTKFNFENKDCDKHINVEEVYSHLTNRSIVYKGEYDGISFVVERWV